jgi:hypothetical protein
LVSWFRFLEPHLPESLGAITKGHTALQFLYKKLGIEYKGTTNQFILVTSPEAQKINLVEALRLISSAGELISSLHSELERKDKTLQENMAQSTSQIEELKLLVCYLAARSNLSDHFSKGRDREVEANSDYQDL